jgi:hypothetical protein
MRKQSTQRMDEKENTETYTYEENRRGYSKTYKIEYNENEPDKVRNPFITQYER